MFTDYTLYALVSFALVTQPAVFATTIYLHRGSAHRALTFSPLGRFLLESVLWITTGLVGRSRRYWVAVHRKHHAHSDVEGDPHSPVLEGFPEIQWGNAYYYLRAGRRDPHILSFARDIKFSLAERTIFRIPWLGPLIGILILIALFGTVPGLFMAGMHTFLYVVVLNGAVNGLCHVWGYKNFERVVAFNVRLVALLTGGEGLHNNHHENPNSPLFRRVRGEIDLAEPVIRTLIRLRLARFTRA